MNKVSDKLKQRSNQFAMVLNDSGADIFKNSDYLFKECLKRIPDIGFLALICHENEWDSLEKRVKTMHYHLVFNLRYQRVSSLANMLKMFVDAFHCNENQISIEKCTDMCASCRYLIHLDNVDKQPFLPFDVLCTDEKLFGEYLSRIREITDIKEVIEIAKRYNYSTETIMLNVGKKNWKN